MPVFVLPMFARMASKNNGIDHSAFLSINNVPLS
jgi:hypothetical protein